MPPTGFAEPADCFRPRVRWWWPGGAVSTEGITEQLRALRDAGFARAEIAMLPMGLPAEVTAADIRTWGTPRFTAALRHTLTTARDLGMRIDLTISPGWPLASPAVTGDGLALSQRKLVRGVAPVADGPIALPPAEGEADPGDLFVAATAARVVARDTSILLADPIDLTDRVHGDRVDWTPPEGEWLVFSFWSRPSGQRSLAEAGVADALVVDHFSAEATAATTAHIDRYVLPAELDELLRAAGGDVFEDSLEIATDAEMWTATLLSEFTARRGYDLTPYLPALRVDRLYRFDWETLLAGITPESPADYEVDRGRRIRHDYYRTLNELYADNHVRPLTRWVNGRGLKYRAQPYGNTMDHVEIAASIQVPESEDLVNWIAAGGMTEGAVAYSRAVDFHRGIASGAHMSGAQVVSMECCAVLGADYRTTLADVRRHADVAFAGGVNQVVLHGMPYQEVAGAVWPGWAPFSSDTTPDVSDAWGPRQPMWRHIRPFTDYLARAAAVLRYGRPRVDVAVYKQDYWVSSWPKVSSPALADAGYTYDFLTPNLLLSEAAEFRDGLLAPDRAGYRALLLVDQNVIDPRALARIVELARAGLPVVVAGELPARSAGYAGLDEDVVRLSAELAELAVVVPGQNQLPGALIQAGVAADARLSGCTGVVALHRHAPDGDYYYLYNMGEEPASVAAELAGEGAARVLDLWHGTAHPAVLVHGAVRLELPPRTATVVSLGDEPVVAAPARVSPVEQRWEIQPTEWSVEVTDAWSGATETGSGLGSWLAAPALAELAGVGIYRTTLVLEPGWDEVDAVWLDLGTVAGSHRVLVNGAAAETADLRGCLRTGENAVTVEVATPLGNRLVALARSGDPAYKRFAEREPQDAGLLGPVRLRGVASV